MNDPPGKTLDDREIFIFIDNSNLLHQAQSEVPGLMKLPDSTYIKDLGIDHHCLVSCILGGRTLGENPVIVVTSTPSPLQKEWEKLREPFKILAFPRNVDDKEKGNDVALAVEATKVIFTKEPPGILALVLGDGDYVHLAREAIAHGWDVELYFWSNRKSIANFRTLEFILTNGFETAGIAKRLTEIPSIRIMSTLVNSYEKFMYAYGDKPSNNAFSLEITIHESVDWDHRQIFDIACRFDTFAWWNLLGQNTLRFFFLEKEQMENAKTVLSIQKPTWEVWQVYQPGRKRKGGSTCASDSTGRSSYKKNK